MGKSACAHAPAISCPQRLCTASGLLAWKNILGRQSLLAGYFLQFRQIGIRIAAKAGPQSACLAPLIETVAKLLPLAAIRTTQISATGWRLAGRDGRDQARRTTAGEAVLRPVARRSW
jgi:hypothetical protein